MSDYTLEAQHTGIFGVTGTGKTTLAFMQLRNTPAAARFIYDDRGQASMRLRIPLCFSRKQLEDSLRTRWTLFGPGPMARSDFGGNYKKTFAWFCDWVFKTSQRGPGKKLVFADEIWRHCSPNSIPVELATIAQEGRSENLSLITATQRPHKLNESILGALTEMVCFRLQTRLALECVTDTCETADLDRIKNLPKGSFVSYALEKGTSIAGKIF